MEAVRVDYRPQRAALLLQAKGSTIREVVAGKYVVPSATGSGRYLVDAIAATCTCLDFEEGLGTRRCKHLLVILHLRHEMELPDGGTVVFEKKKKDYYFRPWKAIHRAREEFGRRGAHMLAEAVDALGLPPEPRAGRRPVGRPSLLLRDSVFGCLVKEFTGAPASTAVGYLHEYKRQGLIEHVPGASSLLREMGRPDLQPIFQQLLDVTSRPLIAIETSAAATDSTGFGTSILDCWNRKMHGDDEEQNYEKWLEENQGPSHRWVKLHATFVVKTKGIISFQVTESRGPGTGDSPMFPELVKRAYRAGLRVRDWTGDKAYGKASHYQLVQSLGMNPFLAFKKDARGRGSPAKERMYDLAQEHPAAFKRHYIQRVQAEAGFFALKERFGRKLDTRLPMAQYNELSARCICHNIYCVLRAKHELQIEPSFFLPTMVPVGLGVDDVDDDGLFGLGDVLHDHAMNDVEQGVPEDAAEEKGE